MTKRIYPADVQATVEQIMASSRARFGHGRFVMVKPQEPAAPQEFPSAEDLQAMTPEALEDARTAAEAEAEALRGVDPADATDEQIDRMTVVADFLDAVDAESTTREQQAAERTERARAAAERLQAPDPEEEGAEGDDPAEGEEGEEGAEGDEGGDQSPEAIAAGANGRRPAGVRQMARRAAPPRRPAPAAPESGVTITAGADVAGYSAGQTLDSLRDVAKAFVARSKAFPKGVSRQANVRQGPFLVASLERRFDDVFGDTDAAGPNRGLRLTESMDDEQMYAVLASAADTARLPGGGLIASRKALAASGGRSLAASGGWCAPSETIYTLTAPETLDGIINLPEVGVSRGGVRFTEGPDFATIFAEAGFAQTEAQAIAGDTKDCVEVDCPDFDEVRLDAVGICVKSPLLTQSAYPELVERFIGGVTVANEHKKAGRLITAMEGTLVTGALDYTTSAAGTPLAWGLLTALELQSEAERQARRLGDNSEMEVILPHWVKPALRADLANRNHVGYESVSDAQVMAHFADRNLAVQFIYNWAGQDLTVDTAGPKAFPSSVKAMIYSAGTFVKGTANVINLSTVYDTADLQTNVYTAAFVEDGLLLAKMRPGGRRILFPVHPSGLMAAASLNDDFGSVQS